MLLCPALALAASASWLLGTMVVVGSAGETLPSRVDSQARNTLLHSLPPLAATISQDTEPTLAFDWHRAGFTGRGVKVGVLDLGFLGYANGIIEGELPTDVITKSFIGDGSELAFWGHPATTHGTAVAELIHDVAPGAQLYLANFGSEVEWIAAVDWLLAQDIDVISFSAGWPLGGPGDGTGHLAQKVSAVHDAGVLWVNAAGNSAQRHWMGTWRDDDPSGPDGWHNFGITDGTNEITVTDGTEIIVGLRWDDPWGASTNDYDLFLFGESGGQLEEVARSETVQDGDDDPVEVIIYSVPALGVYHLAISKQPDAVPRALELFSYYQDFHYQTAASSLHIPADSSGSLTVGAILWRDDLLEHFSSQGPTRDGRVKPDLTAPDGILVRTEGYAAGFFGTSASAPHVAGMAALLLEAHPSFTPAEAQSWLEARTVDLGEPGKDNTFGAGRIDLGESPTREW
jgi:subtilisin family serine protease